MNENVENVILGQLREMRADMSSMKSGLDALRAEMHSEFSDVNHKVDGLTLAFTMLMGHVAHLGDRVESIEAKVR